MHQIVAVVPETRFIEKKNKITVQQMLNQTLAQVTIKLNWILVFFFFMVGCLVMVLNYL
jgi:hypothetical protein